MPKLTVQNAEIKTAAVEVRTLTLSGKQVTLSVFKQIEQGDLIQADGTLAGQAWGRVNYHPDKCADASVHHHVVWQEGTELRRCALSPQAGHYGFGGEVAASIVQAAVAAFGDDARKISASGFSSQLIGPDGGLRRYAYLTVENIHFAPVIDSDTHRQLKASGHYGSGSTPWSALVDPLRELASTYRAAYADIERLPQLFIAV